MMTVLTRSETNRLRIHLRQIDPHAFITIVNSSEIIGKGFRSIWCLPANAEDWFFHNRTVWWSLILKPERNTGHDFQNHASNSPHPFLRQYRSGILPTDWWTLRSWMPWIFFWKKWISRFSTGTRNPSADLFSYWRSHDKRGGKRPYFSSSSIFSWRRMGDRKCGYL